MPLLDLPEELLDLVNERLSVDNGTVSFDRIPTLVAASLSCRKLHRVVQPWLYKKLLIGYPSDQVRLLLRTLRQRPQYGKHIHEVIIYVPLGSDRDMGQEVNGNMEDLAGLLFAMPNLRDLWAHGLPSDTLKHILCSSQVPFYDKLEWVVVKGDTYSTEDLFHLLSFPNLHHITIFGFNDTRHCTRLPSHPFLTRLTSLSLPHSRIGHPLMNYLLRQSSHLEHLRCTIPLSGPRLDLPHDPEVVAAISASPLASLSLLPLSQHLVSLKSSLVRLHIETGYQSWKAHEQPWAGPSVTWLNLHDFPVLEEVIACSSCFFPSPCNGKERLGLYTRLPQSLIRLQIDWGFEAGIFFLTDPDDEEHEMHIDRLRRLDFQGMEYGSWIVELAAHKGTCFPLLQEVELGEVMMSLDRHTCYELGDWEPPSSTKDLFTWADIDLRVQYRSNRIPN